MEGRDPLHKQDEYGIVVDQGEADVDEDQHGDMPDEFEGIADADLEEYLVPVEAVQAVQVEDDPCYDDQFDKTYHTLTSVSSMEVSYNDPEESLAELDESIMGAGVKRIRQQQQHSLLVPSGEPVTHGLDDVLFGNVEIPEHLQSMEIPEHLQSTPKKCTPVPR